MRLPATAASVVTGAGGGLGRALSVALGRRGAQVVVSDVAVEGAEETAVLVRRAGGRAWVVPCDVREREQVEALAARARDLAGEIDLLVNNAGVASGGLVGAVAPEDWRWVIDVNLWGVVHGCSAFVPAMRARGRGWVLNVASAAGFTCLPGFAPYSVSKAGVIALSETLLAEASRHGVAVTVVCPSFFPSGIAGAARGEDEATRAVAAGLMRRSRWTADDVAAHALDSLERGRLYAIPMRHARLAWLAKRLAPDTFHRLLPAGWAGLTRALGALP